MLDNTNTASVVLQSYYNAALTNTVVLASVAGKVNIYGCKLENNGAADIFLQLFNAASAGAVTLGVTVPDWTVIVRSGSQFYLQPERALKHFPLGLCIAVTAGRTTAVAPAAAATVDVFFSQS